jgi:hypothetical protein
MEDLILTCPHCGGTIVVHPSELNCRIFRHGVLRTTGEPIHPHAPREECERLVAEGAILGCGGPFRVERSTVQGAGDVERAVVCEYI